MYHLIIHCACYIRVPYFRLQRTFIFCLGISIMSSSVRTNRQRFMRFWLRCKMEIRKLYGQRAQSSRYRSHSDKNKLCILNSVPSSDFNLHNKFSIWRQPVPVPQHLAFSEVSFTLWILTKFTPFNWLTINNYHINASSSVFIRALKWNKYESIRFTSYLIAQKSQGDSCSTVILKSIHTILSLHFVSCSFFCSSQT